VSAGGYQIGYDGMSITGIVNQTITFETQDLEAKEEPGNKLW